MSADVRIAACLIVRDEEPRIAACIAAIVPFVDEVVVADTGSTDRTVSVARETSARVVEVPWTDDFAAARNAAAAACRCGWILSIDADERVHGDPAALRALLAAATVPALSVEIREVEGPNPRGLQRHRAVKLYRPGESLWAGRVHEEVVARDGGRPPSAPVPVGVLGLLHDGYADPSVFVAKVERNLRLARLEAATLDWDGTSLERRCAVLLDLGRTELAAGLRADGAATLASVRGLARPGTPAWVWASDFLAWDAVRHGEPDRAWELLDELTVHGADAQHVRPLAQRLLEL